MPSIDEIAPYAGPAPKGSRPASRSALKFSGDLTRREILRNTAIAAGVVMSVKVTRLFEALPAGAHHDSGHYGYRIAGGCSGLESAFYENSNYPNAGRCTQPCGPSAGSYDYCVQSGSYSGWHRTDGNYGLREEDCIPGSDAYDGWKWANVNCGGESVDFRCHDGWKDEGTAFQTPTACVADITL